MKNLNRIKYSWMATAIVGATTALVGKYHTPSTFSSGFHFGWYDSVFFLGVAIWLYATHRVIALYAAEAASTETVTDVLETHYGGIYKRIDENRELLELLQQEAPELLKEKFWIDGWIKSQDGFLCDLAKFAPSERPMIVEGRYPRPWPGKKA